MDVFRSSSRSLAYIIAQHKNDDYVKAVLSILIADTADFLNVGKTISGPQIMQTIELILEDFSIYKIDFFIACFTKAKKGFYGKQYDRLDGQIIFEWLTHYEYEYQTEIERGRETEKILLEKGIISLESDKPDHKCISDRDNTPVPMPNYVKEAITAISTKKVLPVKERVKTEAEIVMQGFLLDFDDLYEKYGQHGGIKIVALHGAPGKSMSVQDYVECRALAYENGIDDPLLKCCLDECVEALKKFHEARRQKVKDRQNNKKWNK